MPSKPLYAAAIFSGAFLLFLVEPLAAKQLLPVLGGSSAVWMTCLVFFQLLLLLGYLYAHALTSSIPANLQRPIHITLLAAAAVLAITHPHPTLANPSLHPVATIFLTLTLSIGLPFLLLASTSPLLQVWLSRKQGAPIQYRLFALSNLGSFLALLAYPAALEPHLTLHHQTLLWSLGFLLYALLAAALTLEPHTAPPIEEPSAAPRSSLYHQALWFFLPMVAATQLAAVTGHLTQDVAAIPLLWVLPLAIYLLSFIAAFEAPRLYHQGILIRLLIVFLAALGYMLSKTDFGLPILLAIGFFLLELFFAAWFCHAETHALRPANPAETTRFYLLIAAGGVTGTFLIAIASPLLFDANYDVALAFTLTAIAGLAVTWRQGWSQRLLWTTGAVLLLLLCFALHLAFSRRSLVMRRNFYASLRVEESYAAEQQAVVRTLLNGHIKHGTQWFSPELQHVPTTYYATDSGLAVALALCCDIAQPRRIGVIGLGAGTVAAYGRPADHIRFYEINPAVRPIAEHLFTYLRDSRAQISFAEGDARISLAGELAHAQPQHFDVLVVDAFTGDAIPLHLLTREAMQLYQSHMAPNGIIAFHVSNQFLDLAPAVTNVAASLGMGVREVRTPGRDDRGETAADWVLVTGSPSFLNNPTVARVSFPRYPNPQLRTWTDDYSTLLPLLKKGFILTPPASPQPSAPTPGAASPAQSH